MLGPLGMRGVVRSMGRRGVGKASEPALAALAGEWQSFLLPVTEVASCLPLIFSYNTVSYTVYYCKSLPFFYFLTFEKGRLLYIHPVGWLVGWLVGRRHH